MDFWIILVEMVVLTGTAMMLGLIFERIGQSSVSGYLLAGMLIGPSVFNLVSSRALVESLAELGVALLLFTIGLEFSIRRLRSLGRTAFGGGILQIIFTALVIALAARLSGIQTEVSLILGLLIAPSSTAVVIRLLRDRSEMDSIHGRHSLGILLLQDAALAPLVIMVTALSGSGVGLEILAQVAKTTAVAAALFGALYLAIDFLFPRLIGIMALTKNRELFMLLSAVTCAGSALIAHSVGLSPSLGAFAAGVFLAESPFAAQIRSDVGPFRALFATIFFCSIGMLADVSWIAGNWVRVLVLTILIVVGTGLIVWLVLWLFGVDRRHSVATAATLAQVGEFSFVLGHLAFSQGSLDEDLYRLVLSASIVSLFATPFLVRQALTIGRFAEGLLSRPSSRTIIERYEHEESTLEDHIIVVGFGPAGEEVARTLREEGMLVTIVDLSPSLIGIAKASCSIDG
jgi:CPA2 family monovalent cation:H+ antiporter-2